MEGFSMKNKLLKMLMLVMLLTMMFSVNVFAAEGAELEQMSVSSDRMEYNNNEIYTLPYVYRYANHELELNINFRIEYIYSEASWVYVTLSDININSAKVNGVTVIVAEVGEVDNAVGMEKCVLINEYLEVVMGVRVDEYGEVTTYAYINEIYE